MIHGWLGTSAKIIRVPQLPWIMGQGAVVHQQRAAAGQQDGVELGAAEQ